jgi:two-component system cell cycle sensor histidine kinase/response regulator CckA
LSTAEVLIRKGDLNHIEAQSAELSKNHEQVVDARKMEAVARLSAGVAHEFNNILTAIMGFTDVIDRRPADNRKEYTARIREASVRASQLVEGLLAYSQQQLIDQGMVNLDDWIRNQERRLRAELRPETRLLLRFSSETKIVDIDSGLLQRAMLTVVKTAEENLPEGGTLSVETGCIQLPRSNRLLLPHGEYCTIRIRDNGPRKDPETLSRIFEPFFTTGEFGTGSLDLAAAYGIVRQLGGQVETRSDPDHGNSITVTMPRRINV